MQRTKYNILKEELKFEKMELTSSYCAFGLMLFSSTNSNKHKKKHQKYLNANGQHNLCLFVSFLSLEVKS